MSVYVGIDLGSILASAVSTHCAVSYTVNQASGGVRVGLAL